MMPDPKSPVSDPMPTYISHSAPHWTSTVVIGQAHVTAGPKVGNKWMGCTYIRPPFTIPGFGELVEEG